MKTKPIVPTEKAARLVKGWRALQVLISSLDAYFAFDGIPGDESWKWALNEMSDETADAWNAKRAAVVAALKRAKKAAAARWKDKTK